MWPLARSDITTVRAVEAPHRLELDARLWPAGAADIRLDLVEIGPGTTEVRMAERITRGPGRLVPQAVQDLALTARNNESLRRLAALTVGRSSAGPG